MTRKELELANNYVDCLDKIDSLKSLKGRDDFRIYVQTQDEVLDITKLMDEEITDWVLQQLESIREIIVESLSHFHCDLSDNEGFYPDKKDQDIK